MKRETAFTFARLLSIGASIPFLLGGCFDPAKTTSSTTFTPTSVVTFHNDLPRSGQNVAETVLKRSNVNPTTFGKINSLPVDDLIYAQPLVAAGVNGKNLVIVATEGDSVYAYDEEAITATNPSRNTVWERHFLTDNCPSGATCSYLTDKDTLAPNIEPDIGITATPVIDKQAGLIYLTAVDKETIGSASTINWKLHVLSLATGEEQPGSPVVITGSAPYPGQPTGVIAKPKDLDSTGTKINFYPNTQLSRAGLVLSNNVIYIAFSTWNDIEPDHGWVFGYTYDGKELTQLNSFITTPYSGNGSIWQAGGAPAVDDAGNIFFATGNGDPNFFDNTKKADGVTIDHLNSDVSPDYSDSVLKLTVGGTSASGLTLADYFTPNNWAALAIGDVDLGAGGVLLLPDSVGSTAHPHLMVAGGKQGALYLIDRDNLGKYNSTGDQVVAENTTLFSGGTNHGPGLYGIPSFYNNTVFFMPAVGALTALPISNGAFNYATARKSTIIEQQRGSTVSISANGTSDGIVWYIDPSAYLYSASYAPPPNPPAYKVVANGPGILYAFNSDDFTTPLYASNNTTNSDAAGYAVKFAVPTVANGLVFVGTQTELTVYGLKDRTSATATAAVASGKSTRTFASVGAMSWFEKLINGLLARCSSFSF